jgi:anti-sigma factor RsiW
MTRCYDDGALRAGLDGELSAEALRAQQAHLAVCAACRARQAELHALSERAALLILRYQRLPATINRRRPCYEKNSSWQVVHQSHAGYFAACKYCRILECECQPRFHHPQCN